MNLFPSNMRYRPTGNIRIAALLCLVAFLTSCNLLGISPQRRKPPVKTKTQEVNPVPDTPKKQEDLEELTQRIEELENRIQQERSDYQKQLKSMDRTISLLEQNILQMKSKMERQAIQESQQKTRPKRETIASKQAKRVLPGKAPDSRAGSASGKQPNASGDIKTPQTSKAIETISLLKSGKKKQTEAVKQPEKNLQKFPIVGMEPETKKKSQDKETPAWEDPDLKNPPSPIQLTVISGAKRRYQEAFKIYSGRNYEESIKRFNSFLIDFPNDQDADNSQFWIGQAYFQQGNYLFAERAFRKVLRNYPHGTTRRGYKTPDAVLMLGRIYLIRKKPIKARYYFEQVVKHYPDSRSAVKAARELEAMESF